METKLNLRDDTIDALQDLIQTNMDSAACLKEASEAVDDPQMSRYFASVEKERRKHANELSSYVSVNQETPESSTSIGGEARKLWLRFRSAISGGDTSTVLVQAEKAEDVIKGKYEDLLQQTAGSAMNDVLMRHMREVKRHHDQIRDMRDAA